MASSSSPSTVTPLLLLLILILVSILHASDDEAVSRTVHHQESNHLLQQQQQQHQQDIPLRQQQQHDVTRDQSNIISMQRKQQQDGDEISSYHDISIRQHPRESFSCVGSGCYVALLAMMEKQQPKQQDLLHTITTSSTASDASPSSSSSSSSSSSPNHNDCHPYWNALMIDPIVYGCPNITDCLKYGSDFKMPSHVTLPCHASKIRVFASGNIGRQMKPQMPVIQNGFKFLQRQNFSSEYEWQLLENKAFGWLSMVPSSGVSSCRDTKWPFIRNCAIDAAELVLKDTRDLKVEEGAVSHQHQKKQQKHFAASVEQRFLDESFYAFNQSFFAEEMSGMASKGFIYIPDACRIRRGGTTQCPIHFHFHHCMSLPFVSSSTRSLNRHNDRSWYLQQMGLNEWAEKLGIIVVYPQIDATTDTAPPNPRACFDYYGATSHLYDTPDAPQVKSIQKMKKWFQEGRELSNVLLGVVNEDVG